MGRVLVHFNLHQHVYERVLSFDQIDLLNGEVSELSCRRYSCEDHLYSTVTLRYDTDEGNLEERPPSSLGARLEEAWANTKKC